MPEEVFVYGTLRRGGANHGLLAPFVRREEAGTVPGVLLDLGGYPGWVEGEGAVRGEVFRLEPPALALVLLDDLEEYFGAGDPRNLYERVRVTARTADGPVEAWAYRYVGPREGAAPVPGGEWRGSEE